MGRPIVAHPSFTNDPLLTGGFLNASDAYHLSKSRHCILIDPAVRFYKGTFVANHAERSFAKGEI
jgi:hypothetical protein